MAMIRPVSTTMGVSTPATVAEDAGAGGYKYRGDPDWTPGDPRYREPGKGEPLPQNARATTGKRQRMAEYTRLRLEGASKDQAAAEIGISSSTAGYYERDFQDRQRGEAAP